MSDHFGTLCIKGLRVTFDFYVRFRLYRSFSEFLTIHARLHLCQTKNNTMFWIVAPFMACFKKFIWNLDSQFLIFYIKIFISNKCPLITVQSQPYSNWKNKLILRKVILKTFPKTYDVILLFLLFLLKQCEKSVENWQKERDRAQFRCLYC